MKNIIRLCAVMLMSTLAHAADVPPTISIKSLNGETAMQAASAAYASCSERGMQVAVAVVDRQGRMLAFIRNPLAGVHTIEVSQRKAYTAATYRTATTAMMDREHLKLTPGVLLLGGGLPIVIGGEFYGAIGVSGAPAEKIPGDVDEACAQAGIAAITEAIEFGD